MYINSLIINNLRNHEHSETDFSEGLNIIYGANGEGKTTMLEAISICSYSKSFLSAADSSLIRNGSGYYFISTQCENDLGIQYKISIKYTQGSKKLISSSHGDNLLPKDIIGELPLVALSPDYRAISSGSPQDRRQFIDRLLSQASRIYIESLMNCNRTLKQRNMLLSDAKIKGYYDKSQLQG
ncbi:MAG: replication and repair protein RecF, partial [Bacteroidota bacterium]|nr:replication and repair protein RecF [Bacteroidota bacterium]